MPKPPPNPPRPPDPRRPQPLLLAGEITVNHKGLPMPPVHDEKCARQGKEILAAIAALSAKLDLVVEAVVTDPAKLQQLSDALAALQAKGVAATGRIEDTLAKNT